MDMCKEAVMCSECTNNLEVLFKFKSACDYMIRDVNVPADIKDGINLNRKWHEITDNIISPTDNLMSLTESKNEVKCCFCAKTSIGEFLTSLNESKDHTYLVEALKKYIPKLNFTQEFLMCDPCLDALQGVLSFVMKCWDVEQKISKYIEIKGIGGGDQVELKDLQQFIFKPTVKFEIESEDVNELREKYDQLQDEYTKESEAEIKFDEDIENLELFIKEEVDIKLEQIDSNSFEEPSIVIKIDHGSLDIPVGKSQRRQKECVNCHDLICDSSDEKNAYRCESCPSDTKCEDYVRGHKSAPKSTSAIFKCDLCPYATKQKRYLKGHILTHKSTSEMAMFKCVQCPYEGKQRRYLMRHIVIHKSASEVTVFKCEVCQYETRYKQHFKRHELKHKSSSAVAMFKCELCPYETKWQTHLKQHKFTHKTTSDINTVFKCELCPYEAKWRSHLRRHKCTYKTISDNNTVFKCNLCPYETKHCSYETKHIASLKRHQLVHKNTSILSMFGMCP